MALTITNSQLEGTIGATGGAVYVARVTNTFPVAVSDLDVTVELNGTAACPLTSDQIRAVAVHVDYPGENGSIPPGESAVISVSIQTDNAPTVCDKFLPQMVLPSFEVEYQLVNPPPAVSAKGNPFVIGPAGPRLPVPLPLPAIEGSGFGPDFFYVLNYMRAMSRRRWIRA